MNLVAMVLKHDLKKKFDGLKKIIKRPYCLLKQHEWVERITYRGWNKTCVRCGFQDLKK